MITFACVVSGIIGVCCVADSAAHLRSPNWFVGYVFTCGLLMLAFATLTLYWTYS